MTTIGAIAALFVPHPAIAATFALLLLLGAVLGPRWNLWSILYRALIAPRLTPPGPERLEPSGPPRFANLLGGVFLAAAAASMALDWLIAGQALAGIVGLLAFLNAATGLCVGCRLYGLLVLRPAVRAARRA